MKKKQKVIIKVTLLTVILVVAGLGVRYNLNYTKDSSPLQEASKTIETGFPFIYETTDISYCEACLRIPDPIITTSPINQWARLGDILIVLAPASLLAWLVLKRF